MASDSEIVDAARGWLGTPYLHQTSVKGAGSDCLGLLRGVWREVLGTEPELAPPYSMDWSEPQGQEWLWQAANRHLIACDHRWPLAGHVILFRMRSHSVAKHLGIVAEVGARPSFVHAYSAHGVVESSLSLPWRRRIVAQFKFPEEAS